MLLLFVFIFNILKRKYRDSNLRPQKSWFHVFAIPITCSVIIGVYYMHRETHTPSDQQYDFFFWEFL